MHIPDNYLSPVTCGAALAIMIPVWAIAVKKVKEELKITQIPLLGISAAFCFLIMMFNLPLPGGTTGHAVGATLISILIGPWSAILCITIALLIQALFFGDGGLVAFGANCFNIAFIMPFVGFYLYRFLSNFIKTKNSRQISIFIAAYISLSIGALFTAIEFGIQPLLFKDANGLPLYCPYPISISVPAMMIPHLLIGSVVEGMITVGIFSFISKASPETIYGGQLKPNYFYLFILTIIILSPIGLIASGTAWGEWDVNEISKLTGHSPSGMLNGFEFSSLFPDYAIHGVNQYLSYILSALTGVIIILMIFKLFFRGKENLNEPV